MFKVIFILKTFYELLPLRFKKAGRLWCGGVQGTQGATCHNRVTPSETKEFFKSPCFLDLNGIFKIRITKLLNSNNFAFKKYSISQTHKVSSKISRKTCLSKIFSVRVPPWWSN